MFMAISFRAAGNVCSWLLVLGPQEMYVHGY